MKLVGSDWPVFGWLDDIAPVLATETEPLVLATIVAVEGSARREVGTQMLFRGARAWGYLSGGCIEADIADHAVHVLADGQPRLLVYGTRSAWIDVRLTCGGRVEILLERIDLREPACQGLIAAATDRVALDWSSDGRTRVAAASFERHPAFAWDASTPSYRRRQLPPWRLVVVGSDPTALAIADLGHRAGLTTSLVRHPTEEPRPENVVEYVVIRSVAPASLPTLDYWTALVAATHEADLDDMFVAHALASEAAYVGVLGATASAAARRDRLAARGLSEAQLDRLRSPAGIARVGKTPWQVAVSVIADIMQRREADRSGT